MKYSYISHILIAYLFDRTTLKVGAGIGSTVGAFILFIFQQSGITALTLGIIAAAAAIGGGAIAKLIDVINDNRKEKKKAALDGLKQQQVTSAELRRIDVDEAAELREYARQLRAEERAGYERHIAALSEQLRERDFYETIRAKRSHALNNEVDRLRNIAYKLLMMLSVCFDDKGCKIPIPEVEITNQKLLDYLAELDQQPLPPRDGLPSISEIHETNS